jgi:uncharacterized membrane protein
MLTTAAHLWMKSAPLVIYAISLIPLIIFIPGMLADRLRTLIWLGFVVLLYFYNGIQNLSAPEPETMDIIELVLSVTLFCAAMTYARIRQVRKL